MDELPLPAWGDVFIGLGSRTHPPMDPVLLAHFTPDELPVTAAIFVAGIGVGVLLGRALLRPSAWRRPFGRRDV
jgi:hypothetical protein